ncbi:MAG TPA: glycosyltransferase [Novosphingobium sp.]|nr:glycosyltransferase [Novosphingobium sp.]
MHHTRIMDRRAARPLRLLLLLANWTGGGAERVAVHLMNGLHGAASTGFAAAGGGALLDVHLGLLHNGFAWRDQLDRARVHVAPDAARFGFDRPNRELFGPAALATGAIHAPRAVGRIIAEVRPDVVMSFLKGTALLTWLALARLPRHVPRPRWIIREGNNILATVAHESPGALSRAASLALTARAYRRADAVLAVAHGMAADLPLQLGLDPERVHAINNPVDIEAIARAARLPAADLPARPYVLAVGRLQPQKGHDLLITAFARSGCAATHELVILGEGSCLDALRRLAGELGVANRVRFAGFTLNPHAWMAAAELFVLPSRWEGFPNAAAEAMAAGAPLLLTNCKYGAADLVADGINGTLVPVDDIEALAAAMARLLASPAARARHAAAGRIRARCFARDKVLGRYASLVAQVASAPNELARTALPLRTVPA